MRLCSVEKCKGKHEARGLCHKHYSRQKYQEAHPDRVSNFLRSDNLRPVKLDSVAVGRLIGVLERLPGKPLHGRAQ